MPHATNQYRFEWKILEWAGRLGGSLSGQPHVPFLILFSSDGRPQQIHFGHAPEQHDEPAWRRLRESTPAWFAYDPFEGPVYTSVSWQHLPKAVFERLLGTPFVREDLTANGRQIEFPDTWSVMF